MATFDALMEQGDPGSLADESKARDLQLSDPRMSPLQLRGQTHHQPSQLLIRG